ncbi:MlaA family lipoprotein [Sphingomonas koreensis]
MISPAIGALLLASAVGSEAGALPEPSILTDPQDVPATSTPGGLLNGQEPPPPSAKVPPAASSPQASRSTPTDIPSETEQEIVVTGRAGPPPDDPLERVNMISFELTQKVDEAVVGPAARAYQHIVPKPVRSGLRNFLNNLREPVVFVNYLIQLKPGKAAETVGRFALNSTLGVGGFVDVAKRCPFNLPWRPNGFSDTLGVYGVKEGPYLFVPLIGPTTIRELVGGAVDRIASPLALGGPFKSRSYLVGSNIYRVLDRRAEMEDELQAVRESADPYSARRDLYLKKRQARVDRLRGDASDEAATPVDASTDPSTGPDAPLSFEPGSGPPCPSAGAGGAPTFTGPRVGASIGFNRSAGRHILPGPDEAGGHKIGVILRGSVGYDLPVGAKVIAGAEVGAATGGRDIVTQRGNLHYRIDPGFTLDASARLGVKPSAQLLLFGKAGWAMQRVTTVRTIDDITIATKGTRHGFLWGVGAEYALAPGMALRAEFDHVKFNDRYSRIRLLSGIGFRF